MNPSQPAPAAVDSSALCRACGICCGWAIFGTVGLRPDELGWASARRLPLVRVGDEVSFRLPCAVLQVEGDQRVCGDYAHRPEVCRAFRCKLLARYESGELELEDAIGVVKKTRGLIEGVERRLESKPGIDVGAKLARLGDAGDGSPQADADTLLELGVLRTTVSRHFHTPKTPTAGAEDDGPAC
jgi:Fe-S-cluster containining protein